jgi:hypothetical protein
MMCSSMPVLSHIFLFVSAAAVVFFLSWEFMKYLVVRRARMHGLADEAYCMDREGVVFLDRVFSCASRRIFRPSAVLYLHAARKDPLLLCFTFEVVSFFLGGMEGRLGVKPSDYRLEALRAVGVVCDTKSGPFIPMALGQDFGGFSMGTAVTAYALLFRMIVRCWPSFEPCWRRFAGDGSDVRFV